MYRYLSNPLTTILALSTVLTSVEAFTTPTSPISQNVLKVRGGSNPLDVIDVSNVIVKVGLGVGTATAVSTSTVLRKIGIINADPISLLASRSIGLNILNYSLVAYCLLFQDTSVPVALGIGCLPYILEVLKNLFDGTPKKLGFPAGGQVVALFATTTFSYLFLNDSSISKGVVMKLYSIWLILNGVLLGCFPKLACKAWGDLNSSQLPQLQSLVSFLGFTVISLGTLAGFLTTNVMTTEALALGTIPFLSKFILNKFA